MRFVSFRFVRVDTPRPVDRSVWWWTDSQTEREIDRALFSLSPPPRKVVRCVSSIRTKEDVERHAWHYADADNDDDDDDIGTIVYASTSGAKNDDDDDDDDDASDECIRQ